jgi:hypothetical protein
MKITHQHDLAMVMTAMIQVMMTVVVAVVNS